MNKLEQNPAEKSQDDKTRAGFTLLEVLIALFIFTILSVMLVSGLRTVIDAHAGAERKAEILRKLQFACLVISRDLTQAVNRPIWNSANKEEAAFIGTPYSLTLTHGGFANLNSEDGRESLVRSGYVWREKENALWRLTWDALDQAPKGSPHGREILTGVRDARFQYLTDTGRFVDQWPLANKDDRDQSLPRAVKIEFSLANFGRMSQFYIIPIKVRKNEKPPIFNN